LGSGGLLGATKGSAHVPAAPQFVLDVVGSIQVGVPVPLGTLQMISWTESAGLVGQLQVPGGPLMLLVGAQLAPTIPPQGVNVVQATFAPQNALSVPGLTQVPGFPGVVGGHTTSPAGHVQWLLTHVEPLPNWVVQSIPSFGAIGLSVQLLAGAPQ
jgi:hypothetical protein